MRLLQALYWWILTGLRLWGRVPVPVRIAAPRPRAYKKVPGTFSTKCQALFLVVLVAGLLTAPGARAGERLEQKMVRGKVVSLSAGVLGIEYSRAKGVSKEILIPLDQKEPPQLSHLRSLDEIQTGDTISVEYQEQYTEDDEGTRSDFKRVARRIALVRRATEGTLRSTETPNE